MMQLGLAPEPANADLQALRDDYRARKAAVLATLQAQGASTRGIPKLLQRLAREADVAVSPGIGFGDGGDGHVRFALVENVQRIGQATRAVKKLLDR